MICEDKETASWAIAGAVSIIAAAAGVSWLMGPPHVRTVRHEGSFYWDNRAAEDALRTRPRSETTGWDHPDRRNNRYVD